MSTLAETAQLVVALKLKDEMSGSIATAKGQLSSLDRTAHTTATGSFTRLQTSATGVGNALKHAGTQLKNLALGFGVGAGLIGGASIVGFFEQGIEKARDFGTEVSKLVKITGMGVPATSAMAAALEHFGISSDKAIRSIGMLEKNVGLLVATGKDAEFQTKFGFTLRTTTITAVEMSKALVVLKDKHASAAAQAKAHAIIQAYDNSKIKDANSLLLEAADYFNNKNIPATQKAVVMSKLFGRSWQDLIPVLSVGSKGIKEAADEAERLGLTLTKDNVADLAKLKEETRAWNTALGGLQLQIGLLLVGPLTELTKAATDFISNPDNRRGILGFFKSVLETARTIGGILANTVIPTIQGLASTAKTFWDGVPGPLRDLLVKGVAADRVIKFAFGFSPIKFVTDGLGEAVKHAFGGVFERGGSPANPMWVQSVGGGPGGGPSVPGEGGSSGFNLMSLLRDFTIAGAGGEIALALTNGIHDLVEPLISSFPADISNAIETGLKLGQGTFLAPIIALNNIPAEIDKILHGDGKPSGDGAPGTYDHGSSSGGSDHLKPPTVVIKGLANIGIDLKRLAAQRLQNLHTTPAIEKMRSQLVTTLQKEAAALKSGNTKNAHALELKADALRTKLAAELAKNKAATDAAKVALTTAVHRDTDKLEPHLTAIQHKKTQFHITVPISLSTNVSVRDITKRTSTSGHYNAHSYLQAS